MQRAIAYAALASQLEQLRDLPIQELVAHIGHAPITRTVQAQGEELTLDLSVRWEDKKKCAVRIEGTARGPSNWRLELIQEGITVELPRSSAYSSFHKS